MGLPTSLSEDDSLLIADTSTVINLNATDCAEAILRALPCRVAVVDVVADELEDGRPKGRNDAAKVLELITENLIEVVRLSPQGLIHFESLVVGAASETLDDGEAATLAYATEAGAVALIDERKAIRLSAARFPDLRLACTVDLFAHASVQHALGRTRLADAVYGALLHARMRVLPHHLDGIIDLIGYDRASQCVSLPQVVRGQSHSGTKRAR